MGDSRSETWVTLVRQGKLDRGWPMPWRELSVMEQREEFVRLALSPGANMSEMCRRFGISRSKGYKWLGRYRAEGRAGLADRSHRPGLIHCNNCDGSFTVTTGSVMESS